VAKFLDGIELRQIYSRYPALARTRTWSAIDDLVRTGNKKAAWALAEKISSQSLQINAQNVLARKLRIARLKFFALHVGMADGLKEMMRGCGARISKTVQLSDGTPAQVRVMKKVIATEIVVLRRAMMKWVTDAIWASVLLSFRNIEESLVPVFKDNEESLASEPWKEMNLMEERLSFGLSQTLVGRGSPEMAKGSQVYKDATDAAYQNIVARNNNGLLLSSRIWDLTERAKLDMQKILENEIGLGTATRDVAKDLEGYLLDEPVSGPGVYSKPLANAMRIARTETVAAYASAMAEWAKTRSWVKGIMVTLSSAHESVLECECEQWAGKIVDADEFASLVPIHPNCMCYGTVVVKDEYLTESVHAAHV
jgi:hypothetical protein